MTTLSDILQLSKLEKEQLIELCNALYALLQDKRITSLTLLSSTPAK